MTEILIRLPVLLSCLAACIYGVSTIQRHFHPPFFKIAVCGMFASFLSRLFYFVLTISNGDDRVFSVGVLGQLSVYLFFIIADLAYVPQEAEERTDKDFCLPAFAVAAIPCAIMAVSALTDGSLGAFIGEALYIITMGPAAYVAIKSNVNRHSNPFRKQITPFNTCVCILIYANAFSELLTVTDTGSAMPVSKWLLTAVSVAAIIAMLPLLQRGLRTWE